MGGLISPTRVDPAAAERLVNRDRGSDLLTDYDEIPFGPAPSNAPTGDNPYFINGEPVFDECGQLVRVKDVPDNATFEPYDIDGIDMWRMKVPPPFALTDQHAAALERAIRREGFDSKIDPETGDVKLERVK
jgi:hypothetical protein